MKKGSLYEDIFNQVDADIQIGGMMSRAALESTNLKYETSVPQLEYMCLIMENMVITKKPKGIIYAGFQKLSRVADPVLERFFAMADSADKVFIFGEHDHELAVHPNIEYIHLPAEHPLVREWFLVINTPILKTMMTAFDTEGFGVHDLEEDRKFRGVKSNSPKLVVQAASFLDELIASRGEALKA